MEVAWRERGAEMRTWRDVEGLSVRQVSKFDRRFSEDYVKRVMPRAPWLPYYASRLNLRRGPRIRATSAPKCVGADVARIWGPRLRLNIEM